MNTYTLIYFPGLYDLKFAFFPKLTCSFLHFQADVNSDNVDDEDEDDTNNSPKETDRLYPTAPLESDDTASVHSTSV